MNHELAQETVKEIFDAKNSQRILTGVVKMARMNDDVNSQELIVDYKGVRCIIPKSEVDDTIQYRKVSHFVGTTIHFIVLSFNKDLGEAICSRAAAQKLARPGVVERLEKGEVMVGKVINILNYGAYIDINGVTGLMKNIDFSSDATKTEEVLRLDMDIEVRLKAYSPVGKLLFEPKEKYRSPNAIDPQDMTVGQIVLGVVRSRQPFGYFINIAPNFDVLASSDVEGEIEVDQKVAIKILKVYHDDNNNLRLRGVIKKVI